MATESACHPSKFLENLPDTLLDELVSNVFKLAPSLRATFIASLGSRVHASAVRVLFNTLSIPDDACNFGPEAGPSILTPLVSNVDRYAPSVRAVVIQDPDFSAQQTYGLFADESGGTDAFRPLDAHNLSWIVEVCHNLEAFVWTSSILPPDGLCEMLISPTSRLTRVSITPRPGPSSLAMPKWDGPSLPLFSSLPLTSLHLSRLSQRGARTLSVLLSNMGEYSTLEDLSVDFVWLDDQLCEMIAKGGGKLRKLRLGTSGTKLTDRGVAAIMEGCDALEELVFDEVQGRLSRSLWTKLAAFPPALRTFQILISESGPHHSWMKDHLQSLHALPFESLRGLSVVRRERLPRLQNGVPIFDVMTDDVVTLKPVPKEFLDKMKDAKLLTCFECDWWSWSIPDLKLVLESCPSLERLKLCLDAPVSKLLSLTSAFASLTHLHTLSICVNPLHAPGKPPVPVPVPLLPQSSLPTPRESPALKAKSVLPQLLDFDQMQTQTCRVNDVTGDPSMPLMRDVKRFVRKCPKLGLFEWYGKAGRGSWTITRPLATTSKISINVSVEYSPPMISEDVWKQVLRMRDMDDGIRKGWNPSKIERVGQAWTGDAAEAAMAEGSAGKEDCISSLEKEKPGRSRDGTRKARLSSVSTSSSSSSGANESQAYPQLPTPTRSAHSQSPMQPFSPLTPSHSETSVLSSVMESAEHGSREPEDDYWSRPIEPEGDKQANGVVRGRTRSATVGTVKENGKQNHERGGASGKIATGRGSGSGGGTRVGRGRGRGTGGRKSSVGDGSGMAGTNGTGRGRGGRGGNHSSTSFGGGKRMTA